MKERKNWKPPVQTGDDITEQQSVQSENKISALTSDESALFQRIQGERDDWRTIGEDSVLDYSMSEDPMKLPDAALEMEREK